MSFLALVHHPVLRLELARDHGAHVAAVMAASPSLRAHCLVERALWHAHIDLFRVDLCKNKQRRQEAANEQFNNCF